MLGLTTFRFPDRFSRLIRLPSGSRYRNRKDICHQRRYNRNQLHSPTGYCEGEGEGEDTEPLKDTKCLSIIGLLACFFKGEGEQEEEGDAKAEEQERDGRERKEEEEKRNFKRKHWCDKHNLFVKSR